MREKLIFMDMDLIQDHAKATIFIICDLQRN